MRHYIDTRDGSIYSYDIDDSVEWPMPEEFVIARYDQLDDVRKAEADAYTVKKASAVPESVTPFQAKAALLQTGLLENVNAALAGASPLARLAWAEATEFKRNSPTVVMLAGVLGLSDASLDELFRNASRITA
jgi:hypothetical protein